jgi:hypothetical protein
MTTRSSESPRGLRQDAPRIRPSWLPETVLVMGLVAAPATLIYALVAWSPDRLPLLLSAAVMVATATLVRRRLPNHPLSGWFAVGAGVSQPSGSCLVAPAR